MLFIVMVCVATVARGEDVKLASRTDFSQIKIGEWVNLHVTAEMPVALEFISPRLQDSIGSFELLRLEPGALERVDGRKRQTWNFRLTSYDTGRVFIPPIEFFYRTAGDSSQKLVYSPPVALTITGVTVDLQEEIKDIKPPLDAPWLFEDFIPYILLLLALIVAGYLFYYWKRRKRKEIEPDRFVKQTPPHESALAALQELENDQLWQQGRIKEYYSRVTEIARLYLEGRFGIPALESTSDEIVIAVREIAEARGVMDELRRFLLTADLVKFAKYIPTVEENKDELVYAYNIVRSTMTALESHTEDQIVEESHVR